MSFTNGIEVRIALDTNILVYAAGLDGPVRKAAALDVLARINDEDLVIPVQALGELFVVLVRKGRWDGAAARHAIARWTTGYELAATTPTVLQAALDIAITHRLAFWDSVVIAATAQAECRVLLSEEMQHGFAWRGVTVRNPFAP